MAPVFNVVEHVIPGQHIREYPNATKHGQEDVLQLSVKQYIPTNQPDHLPHGSLTIIGAHGNGFPKVNCGLKLAANLRPRKSAHTIRAKCGPRRSMNHFGMSYTPICGLVMCMCAVSGLQIARIRVLVGC